MTKIPLLAGLLIGAACLFGIPQKGMAQDSAAKSQSLARLDADSTRLNSDMIAMHARLQDVHKTLWLTKNLLAVPGHLATDLRKLESEMKMLDGLLNTAQAIPQIREDAKRAKQQLDVALKEVSAARVKAEQMERQVEPFRVNIAKADDRIQKIDANAERFRTAIPAPMPTYTLIAQTCVGNSAPARRQCMQTNVDARGRNLDDVTNRLDQVVKLVLTDIPDVTYLKELDDEFEALDKIRAKVESAIKTVESILGPLKEVNSLLGHHFKASFPYPDPTWKNPFRVSHYDVKVSMKTILNGSKAIEDEIEKTLSGALWKAAKVFGVGKLVDSLKHQAESELNSITKKLHLNQNLQIPELAQIDGLFGSINANMAKFPADFGVNLPDFSIDAPSLNYRGQIIDLNAARKLMSELAPNGISGLPANLCNGVSYGCQ